MSAVIYAAIVVMWAVVLVPMWLRRHDAATESRSVERFSTAMRTLSRRTSATPGRRYVVMPRRTASGPSVHVSGAAAPRSPRGSAPVRQPVSKRSIVARRRRALLGMAAVTLLTMLLAAASVISWPLQIVVDVVLIAFCIHLRAQARRAAAVSRQRRRATVAARPAPRVPAPAARAAAAYAAQPAARVMPSVPAATGTDDEVVDDTWDPVPVPRPTYTMKPPAPAFEADPTYVDPVYEPVVEGPIETDLDEILERRWAVND